MGAPIGPGDWVECYRGRDCPPVYVGAIYQCEEVWDDPEWGECDDCPPGPLAPCITLKGINTRQDPLCACTLRPIYRPKADLIESLKAPPQRVGEPA